MVNEIHTGNTGRPPDDNIRVHSSGIPQGKMDHTNGMKFIVLL